MSTNLNRLFLPALRAKMGDWIYYVTLMTMKEVAFRVGIIEEVPQGLPDARGIMRVKESRPDLERQDVERQWRIVRDWISVFFADRFEVAPESFVTRLKPRY